MIRPPPTRLPVPQFSGGTQDPLDEVLSNLFWLTEKRKEEKIFISRIKSLASQDEGLQDFCLRYLEKKNPDLLLEFFSLTGDWLSSKEKEGAPSPKRRRLEPPKTPLQARKETPKVSSSPKATTSSPKSGKKVLFPFKRSQGEKNKIKEAREFLLENIFGYPKKEQERQLQALLELSDLVNEAAEQKDKDLFLKRKKDLVDRSSKLVADARKLRIKRQRELERRKASPEPQAPPEEEEEEEEESPPSEEEASEKEASSEEEEET